MPFWGGNLNADGGRAHSYGEPIVREQQLRGTLCSLGSHFQDVVVGACSDFERSRWDNGTDVATAERIVRRLPFERGRVRVVPFVCSNGTFLAPRLQRFVQDQLRAGWAHKHVYYTEADQRLHACGGLGPAIGLLDSTPLAYLSPNRIEHAYLGFWRMGKYNRNGPVRHWDCLPVQRLPATGAQHVMYPKRVELNFRPGAEDLPCNRTMHQSNSCSSTSSVGADPMPGASPDERCAAWLGEQPRSSRTKRHTFFE